MNPVLTAIVVFFTTFISIIAFAPDPKGQQVKLDSNISEMFLWLGGVGVFVLLIMLFWTFIPRDKKEGK